MKITKESLLPSAMLRSAKRIPSGIVFALSLVFALSEATANEVNLGTANNFAILAGSAITSTGPTTINGNVGSYPTTSVTPGGWILNGMDESLNTGIMVQAKNDLVTAYNAAASLAPTMNLTGTDLGGLTLTPGVYFFSSSAQLTGTLTLNDQGNPDAVFVFQIGSTLTTAVGSSVVTINGGLTPGISTFWQVGSSATIQTGTAFEGNILALTSITMDTGATDLDGRLLARNGAVSLDSNTITAPPAESVPDAGRTLLLLGSGLAVLFAFGRRFSSLAC